MNECNTEKLLSTYPLLYRNLREYGFQCGDGWFDLVFKTSAEIEAVSVREGTPKTSAEWPSVSCLKEKFGTLRVQFHHRVCDAVEAVVSTAYLKSMVVCELCGSHVPLQAQYDSKVQPKHSETLCGDCRKAAHF